MQTIHHTRIRNRIEELSFEYDKETGEFLFYFKAPPHNSTSWGGTSFDIEHEIERFLGHLLLEVEDTLQYFEDIYKFFQQCKQRLIVLRGA